VQMSAEDSAASLETAAARRLGVALESAVHERAESAVAPLAPGGANRRPTTGPPHLQPRRDTRGGEVGVGKRKSPTARTAPAVAFSRSRLIDVDSKRRNQKP
jgi:hypothetical protein